MSHGPAVAAAVPSGRSGHSGARRADRLLGWLTLLAVIGAVLGLLLVQRIGTTYRDGLQVTRDGAEVAALGAASAQQLASDVSDLALAAASGLGQAQEILLLAAESTSDVGVALGTNLADGVAGTANIANGMAGFIEAIEKLIPGNSRSLAEDLRALADGLQPVPDQLRSLGDQLIATSQRLEDAEAPLRDVEMQLTALAASIDEAQTTLAEVDLLARDVAIRAGEAYDRSSVDLWLLRLLVVAMGAGLAIACLAARHAVRAIDAEATGAGGGTRTHTSFETGT